MKGMFINDFANNWRAGDIVSLEKLENGDILVDGVAAVDPILLKDNIRIQEDKIAPEIALEIAAKYEAYFGVKSVIDTIMDCLPQDIDINDNLHIIEDEFDLDIPSKYN